MTVRSTKRLDLEVVDAQILLEPTTEVCHLMAERGDLLIEGQPQKRKIVVNMWGVNRHRLLLVKLKISPRYEVPDVLH
jgi:hypothetical protein